MRILLGGSPCTKWSIAQTNNRETQPNSGIGWELFENYQIALDKYKPDYFLYENNKSASQPIKDEIARQLHVVEPDLFTPDNGVRMTHINSALLSAQNRERFYVTNFGDIYQPEDRGILLKDILETGVGGQRQQDKCRTITAGYTACSQRDMRMDIETNGFMGKQGVVEPVGTTKDGKAKCLRSSADKDGIRNLIGNNFDRRTCVAEPVMIPVNITKGGKSQTIKAQYQQTSVANICCYSSTYGASGVAESVPHYAEPVEWDKDGKPTKAVSVADGKVYTVYEVKDGFITIRDKQYPIKLPDGFYIIRKLTVKECARLQTIPDWYEFPVSDSQAYKMIGNGWTIEVIKYLLSHIPNVQNEEIEVLSMYDGMSCGQIALKELGCNVVRYYATEIDKYAIQTTQHNFPNTIQLGDAFQVRDSGWHL